MLRRPPTSTRTDTLFPYTTLFRSVHALWTLRNNDFQLEGSSRQSGEAGDDYVVDIKTESGHHGTEARGYVTAVAAAEEADAPSLQDWHTAAHRGFQRSAQELIADMDTGAGADTNQGFQRSVEELLADMDGDTNHGFQRSAEKLARDAGWPQGTSRHRAYARGRTGDGAGKRGEGGV